MMPLHNFSLVDIDLSMNGILLIDNLVTLTRLPRLTCLRLRSNPISDLTGFQTVVFRHVTKLDLAETEFQDFQSLNQIPVVFPQLTDLTLSDTPLAKLPGATIYIIGRLATITKLNLSEISQAERQNAEIFYLDKIAKAVEATSTEAEEHQLLRKHPRWAELCERYGEPSIQRRVDKLLDPNTLAARVSYFTFYMSEPLSLETQTDGSGSDRIVEKSIRVPLTTSIYALKGIAGRLLSLPPPYPTTLRLVYETREWDPVSEIDIPHSLGMESEEGQDSSGQQEGRSQRAKKGKFVQREIELVSGTKRVGDWVESTEARVRVELVKDESERDFDDNDGAKETRAQEKASHGEDDEGIGGTMGMKDEQERYSSLREPES